MEMTVLVDQVRNELENDLLDYGWILQIVKDIGGQNDSEPIPRLVHRLVEALLDQGFAEIGDARSENGNVVFLPWSGDVEERKARAKTEIDRWGLDPGVGEGFWLAKAAPLA